MKQVKLAVAMTVAIFGFIPTTYSQWSLSGNSVTSGQFLGTTNNALLEIKRNNVSLLKADVNGNVFIGNTLTETSSNNNYSLGQRINFFYHDNSYAIGEDINLEYDEGGQSVNSFAFGKNLTGGGFIIGAGASSLYPLASNPAMMAIGLGSNLPTIAVTAASGVGTTGRVGIGTTSPVEKLDVNGNINIAGVGGRRIYMGGVPNSTWGIAYDNGNPGYGIFYTEAATDYVSISPNGNATNGVMNVLEGGKVGIGTNSPENSEEWDHVLEVKGTNHSKTVVSSSNVRSGLWSHNSGYYGANPGGITGTTTNHSFSFITNSVMRMMITTDGNLAIGATCVPSGYKMAVKGKIICEELKVKLEGGNCWADYVFNKEYKLMPLDQLNEYIKTNKHLPNIPSAKEVDADGISVSEMQVKQMEKIEELTLYLIQLKEENQALKGRIEVLEQKH